jgi:hypothetical protein
MEDWTFGLLYLINQGKGSFATVFVFWKLYCRLTAFQGDFYAAYGISCRTPLPITNDSETVRRGACPRRNEVYDLV